MIIAKCDASYENTDDGCKIGIGIYIYKDKKQIFKKGSKIDLSIQYNSTYAELISIIETLKQLQHIEGEKIYIYNDCQGIFKAISGKSKKSKFRDRYSIECSFAKFLILKLREKNKYVECNWKPRQKMQECDVLSRI